MFSTTDRSREQTPQPGFRKLGAAASVNCLPAHRPEAGHSLVRPAVLDWPATGMAGLDIGLGGRPTRTVVALHLRGSGVVLDTQVASERRPPARRRRRPTPGSGNG